MRLRVVAAAVVCASLTLGVATASGVPARSASPQRAQATTLRVWLQVDAQQNWEGAVKAASNKFEAAHPGTEVKVEYQTWNDHLTKFDASLAGNNAPDVIELGNTEMTKYMAAGAFADITSAKRSIPNSSTWLKGLTRLGHVQGQALRRPVLRGRPRRDLPHGPVPCGRDQAARRQSLDQFEAALAKLQEKFGKDRRYSASTSPASTGSPRCRSSTTTAARSPSFKGGSGRARSTRRRRSAALTRLKHDLLAKYSKASKTGDEANPPQALVFGKGKVGSFIGNGWEWGYALEQGHGQPGARGQDRRVPDAEPHARQVHADVPRRLRPRGPGHEQEPTAGDRLDQGVHRHRPDALAWRPSARCCRTRPRSRASTGRTSRSLRSPARASSSWFVPAVGELGQRREQADHPQHARPHLLRPPTASPPRRRRRVRQSPRS